VGIGPPLIYFHLTGLTLDASDPTRMANTLNDI
jgi:hypothetical protein